VYYEFLVQKLVKHKSRGFGRRLDLAYVGIGPRFCLCIWPVNAEFPRVGALFFWLELIFLGGADRLLIFFNLLAELDGHSFTESVKNLPPEASTHA
jgi:hypothetical protein